MKYRRILLTLSLAVVLFFPSLLIAGEDPTVVPGYYPKEYLSMKNPLPFSLATLREGRRVYSGHCETCHGVYGDGKGNSAVIGKFDPMPRDFTDDKIMSKKTDGMLYYSISKGVHGTRMFAREDIMPSKDRWAVINFIRTFVKGEETGR